MDVTVVCINDLCSFSSWEEPYHTPSCVACPVPVLEILHCFTLNAMLYALFEGLFRSRYGRRGPAAASHTPGSSSCYTPLQEKKNMCTVPTDMAYVAKLRSECNAYFVGITSRRSLRRAFSALDGGMYLFVP